MDWLRNWKWDLAVEKQRRPLLWIVMVLFSMAKLVDGAVVDTLPRHVRDAILRTLRPAEAAARRLIVMAMRIGTTGPPDFMWDAPERKKRRKGKGGKAAPSKSVPAFPLFDPRKKLGPKKKTVAGYGPRIRGFDGLDDPVVWPKALMPDDEISARRLCLRLLALKAALDDLPGQAARLRRVLTRVKRRWPQPMRVGNPPGFRMRGSEMIDEILAECQRQAVWALKPLEPG